MKNATVMNDVQAILNSYLEEDEVQECIEQLMTSETKATEFETIKIPGSDSHIYAKLIKHKPANHEEKIFIDNLKEAISKSIKDFEVFVNDPSIDNGKLQFVPGFKPAVGYPYNEWEKIAKENGIHLGTKDEYILFMGWLIDSLINEGMYERHAWFAVCTDSKKLGHYYNSRRAKGNFEVTGSRKVAGKCDLANACKILAKDDKAGGYWIASGDYDCNYYPLANLILKGNYDYRKHRCLGWFVRRSNTAH